MIFRFYRMKFQSSGIYAALAHKDILHGGTSKGKDASLPQQMKQGGICETDYFGACRSFAFDRMRCQTKRNGQGYGIAK